MKKFWHGDRRTEKLLKEYGEVVVDKVTISQIIGGMRDIKSLVTDISYLILRRYPLPGIHSCSGIELLPKPKGAEMPYVEGLYFFLLTGDIPNDAQLTEIVDEFNKRRILPRYVYEVIDSFPCCSHPMTIFSTAILSMSRESLFSKKYHAGVHKLDYWDSTYEDALNLLAKLPEIGAYIYRKLYRDGKRIQSNPNLDLGANFAHMMGIRKPYL